MEEFGLTITLTLTRLIMPVSFVAITVGLILFGVTIRRAGRSGLPHQSAAEDGKYVQAKAVESSALERIAVGICGVVAVAGLVASITNEIRRNPVVHPAFFLVLGLFLLLAAPALAWRTSKRVAAEALGTVALAVVTFLSGFSIGFLFVPLVVFMTWVCVQHLRTSRVDSPS